MKYRIIEHDGFRPQYKPSFGWWRSFEVEETILGPEERVHSTLEGARAFLDFEITKALKANSKPKPATLIIHPYP